MQKAQLIGLIEMGIRDLMLGKAAYKPEMVENVTAMVDRMRKPDISPLMNQLFGQKFTDALDSIDKVLAILRGMFEVSDVDSARKCDELIATLYKLKNSNMALTAICMAI